MKLLHTSDWHVGKLIRGFSRADEHRAVLSEISRIASQESVDLVVVAGDLFETAAPSPESEHIVYKAFLELSEIAPVVCVAGNHDNPRRLAAVAPLLKLGRVTMATEPKAPKDGGVVELDLDGMPVKLALLPFVSQRGIVRAEDLMGTEGYAQAQTYAARLQQMVASLSAGFSADAVNLIVAHAFVRGSEPGGGERMAHLHAEYGIPAVAFPATATYVALGHLHRPQLVRGATTIAYSGSPLQLDFGEEAQTKQVNIVQTQPGVPAKVSAVQLESGRQLRTMRGSLAQLEGAAGSVGDAWLRVRVNEAARPGLAEEVRAILGDGVVDVVAERDYDQPKPQRARRDGRSPRELFEEFLAGQDVEDERLIEGFARLHETVLGNGPTGDGAPFDPRAEASSSLVES